VTRTERDLEGELTIEMQKVESVEAVNDSKLFGTWRYLFASETGIKASPNRVALTAG
jgi:hypothetical protein